MHNIYSTYGLIIGSKPYKEAGKIFIILTYDFGMIFAVAEGVRLEKSKLRYHIQEYFFVKLSLVSGREVWRITGAEEYKKFSLEKIAIINSILVPVSSILRRFLHWDHGHEKIFKYIEECADYIGQQDIISKEDIKTLESYTVFRILNDLGYIDDNISAFCNDKEAKISKDNLDFLTTKRVDMNSKINKALRESHL